MNSNWSKSPWFRRALSVVAGAVMALSFQKTNVSGLAWIGPALIVLAARGGNSFRLGWLAGFTQHLILLSWLLNIPVKFFPILGWIALSAYLALYLAAWSWVVSGFTFRASTWTARTRLALTAAVAWVAMEMVIARMFSGFPWNLLGASQQKILPLLQVAAWTGQYGVSFIVVWFSVSLLNAFDAFLAKPGERNVLLKSLALPILVVALIYAFGFHWIRSEPPANRSLRVALVQPSIPQTMIWNPKDADQRFAELLRLTEAALTNKPDLVIWPEAAVPRMVRADVETQRAIASRAIAGRAWFIIGSDDFGARGTNEIYFNSSFLVSPSGELASTYRKRRLVIFGEYVPLAHALPFIKYLTPITGGFTAGETPITFSLGTLGAKTSVLICFEDVFPHYAREHATPEVDFLVNITNDGWFGEGAAQWQHAANAAFRCVENGLPLVRCANNGLSCWIDSFGAMHDEFFEHTEDAYGVGFKIVTVPLRARTKLTFYNQHGDWFGWSCVGIVAVALARRMIAARRKSIVGSVNG